MATAGEDTAPMVSADICGVGGCMGRGRSCLLYAMYYTHNYDIIKSFENESFF